MLGLALFLLFLGICESRISYKGEQVIQCNRGNQATYQQLIDTVDVWGTRDKKIDIRVKNFKEKAFVESLLTECKTVIDDLEEYVRNDESNNLKRRSEAPLDWFDEYHTYEDLDAWYQNLATTAPTSSFVSYFPVTDGSKQFRTYGGIPIKALKISVNPDPSLPSVYMQALIHAREWISGATLNYVLNQLIQDYLNGNPNVVSLLNRVNVHAIPVLNIDGYKWTWGTSPNGDRMWRKNRNAGTPTTCIGVDVNRNYNDHWGQGGSSTNPCSDTYMGQSAASENETQASQYYFKSLSPVYLGIDWHSYGELVLRPYGWSNTSVPPDEPVLKAQGDAYATTANSVHNQTYVSEPSHQLYITTGSADDYFYGNEVLAVNGRRAAGYTVELRPVNNPGFLLPAQFIKPTGEENYKALLPFLMYFASNPLPPSTSN